MSIDQKRYENEEAYAAGVDDAYAELREQRREQMRSQMDLLKNMIIPSINAEFDKLREKNRAIWDEFLNAIPTGATGDKSDVD